MQAKTRLSRHSRSVSEPTLARQCSIFLKGIFHRHQHHPENSDCVVGTHPATRGVAALLINDLKRSMVQVKRRSRHSAIAHACIPGIAAYASSLVLSLQHSGRLSDDDAELELAYLQNVTSSAKSSISTLNEDRSDHVFRSSIVSNVRGNFTFIIILASALIGYVALVFRNQQLQSVDWYGYGIVALIWIGVLGLCVPLIIVLKPQSRLWRTFVYLAATVLFVTAVFFTPQVIDFVETFIRNTGRTFYNSIFGRH